MCKKNCLGCQFFIKNIAIFNDDKNCKRCVFSLTSQEREQIKQNRFEFISSNGLVVKSLACHKGVWDDGCGKKDISTFEKDRFAENSRGNSCFYYPYQEGMLLSAAEELEKRETIQKEANADRKWIKWGFIVAAFGVLISNGLFFWSHYRQPTPTSTNYYFNVSDKQKNQS